MVEYTCDFLRLQATHNIKEFEEQTFASYEGREITIQTTYKFVELPWKRSNVCPNMMLNACVGEYHEGDTRIDFGEDLEHINEFAQVEGEVVNLMVQPSKELVKALELSIEQHSYLYKLGRIKKGHEVKWFAKFQ
ncbi:hypothetical protein Tco_0933234 [Tanacetum coccineum]